MKFFTVHENPHRRDPDDRVVLVKEGFVWAAFFMPVLWLIFKRAWAGLALYAAGVALLIGLCAIMQVAPIPLAIAASALITGFPAALLLTPSALLSAIGLLFAALCGFEAGDTLRFMLARRGYHVTAIVSGKGQIEAEQAYFSAHPAGGGEVQASRGGPSGGGGPGGGGTAKPAFAHPAARRAGDWASDSEPILGLFPGTDYRG